MAEEELRMPFWSHLAELRKRIVVSLIAVSLGFGMSFSFSEDLLALLMIPMNMKIGLQPVFPYLNFTPNTAVQQLYFTTLTEPFMSHLKIAFVAGLILAVPVILHQFWKFISPGLLPRERKYTGYFVLFSTLFFVAGVLFCFFLLLPFAVPFLIGYKTEHLKAIVTIGQYIDFTLKFLLGAGAVFELPLLIILLSRMGIVSAEALARFRKYAFLISFILGAMLTPTPDVFNMTLMSLPIYFLYELGILGARLFGKKKDPESTELTRT
ncbi:MAG: twin arginine-targeting protein translocase TatC [Nitrospirae bacterium GWD2_57_9]|nr:MAG: twin arginine-targeting protein translocase TatC [Nitrospirae bacterium GWD2_57_9]